MKCRVMRVMKKNGQFLSTPSNFNLLVPGCSLGFTVLFLKLTTDSKASGPEERALDSITPQNEQVGGDFTCAISDICDKRETC